MQYAHNSACQALCTDLSRLLCLQELPPEAEEIMCTTAPPLNALANRISPTAPQLEPLPIVHGNAWDAGEFSLHTGNGRTYSFNDAIVKKFTLDEVVHVWEVSYLDMSYIASITRRFNS